MNEYFIFVSGQLLDPSHMGLSDTSTISEKKNHSGVLPNQQHLIQPKYKVQGIYAYPHTHTRTYIHIHTHMYHMKSKGLSIKCQPSPPIPCFNKIFREGESLIKKEFD